MARARKPVPKLEMYRHFAIVTIVVTGTVAMFAEGESRELASPLIAQVDPPIIARNRLDDGSAEPLGSNWVQPVDTGSFGSEAEAGPIDTGSSFIPADFGSALTSRGYSPEYLARLSDEERLHLVEQLQGSQDASITAAEKRQAERSSSMRSGAASLE